MKDVVFCCLAFGDHRYIEQQQRLAASLDAFYPDNKRYFWTDSFPPDTRPFDDSMYGFKVHVVAAALRDGHKKIVFFDPACYLVDKIDYYFEIIGDRGVVAAQDDNLLANFCGEEAYRYFGVTREESRSRNQHLVGGSLYVFDFDLPLCRNIFDTWYQAERDGIFGTCHMQEHRSDESCMALSMYKHGSSPTPYASCRYDQVPDPIVCKKHFK